MRRFPVGGLLTALILVVLFIVLFRRSGEYLVVDNRQKSDVMVITQGDDLDRAYWMGLGLMRDGFAPRLLIDARTNKIFFGRSQADLAGDFIKKTAAEMSGRVQVCPITANTTADEVYEVYNCLKAAGFRSVLLLSDDYHTRRSLQIFSRLLPGYRWSIAPVSNSKEFGEQWWRRREWIRTAVVQWQHVLWWELVDRWRFKPIPAAAS